MFFFSKDKSHDLIILRHSKNIIPFWWFLILHPHFSPFLKGFFPRAAKRHLGRPSLQLCRNWWPRSRWSLSKCCMQMLLFWGKLLQKSPGPNVPNELLLGVLQKNYSNSSFAAFRDRLIISSSMLGHFKTFWRLKIAGHIFFNTFISMANLYDKLDFFTPRFPKWHSPSWKFGDTKIPALIVHPEISGVILLGQKKQVAFSQHSQPTSTQWWCFFSIVRNDRPKSTTIQKCEERGPNLLPVPDTLTVNLLKYLSGHAACRLGSWTPSLVQKALGKSRRWRSIFTQML